MMALRTKIFVIISVLVLFVLGVSIVLVVIGRKRASPGQNVQTTTPASGQAAIDQSNFDTSRLQPPTQTPAPDGLPVKPQTTLDAEKNSVEQLAKVFVERYGTYSNENNFQNIKEIESLSTPALWAKLSVVIRTGSGSTGRQQPFIGVTTKVISTNLGAWNGQKAEVELRAIRTEEKAGVVAAKQQAFTIKLMKQESAWLVDMMTVQ